MFDLVPFKWTETEPFKAWTPSSYCTSICTTIDSWNKHIVTDHPGSQATLQDGLDGETLMRMVGGQSALPQKGGRRTCIVRNRGQIADSAEN